MKRAIWSQPFSFLLLPHGFKVEIGLIDNMFFARTRFLNRFFNATVFVECLEWAFISRWKLWGFLEYLVPHLGLFLNMGYWSLSFDILFKKTFNWVSLIRQRLNSNNIRYLSSGIKKRTSWETGAGLKLRWWRLVNFHTKCLATFSYMKLSRIE